MKINIKSIDLQNATESIEINIGNQVSVTVCGNDGFNPHLSKVDYERGVDIIISTDDGNEERGFQIVKGGKLKEIELQ